MTTFFNAVWEVVIAGGLISVIFFWLIGIQWYWVLLGAMGKAQHSLAPLVGGYVGFLGIIFGHVEGAYWFLWVPFVLDPGSLLMIVSGLRYRKKHPQPGSNH